MAGLEGMLTVRCLCCHSVWVSRASQRREFLNLLLKYKQKVHQLGASLAAQWLRICLPIQGIRVRALVWEDPTCRGATRPMSQSLSLRVWSLCSATREAAIVRGPRTAMKSGPHLPQLEKALAQKRRPNTAIKK